MNDNFYNEAMNEIISFNSHRLSAQAIQLTQQVIQGKTVSEVLDQLSPTDPLRNELRQLLYPIQLAGLIQAVTKLGGITQAQADDLRAYLKDVSKLDYLPEA